MLRREQMRKAEEPARRPRLVAAPAPRDTWALPELTSPTAVLSLQCHVGNAAGCTVEQRRHAHGAGRRRGEPAQAPPVLDVLRSAGEPLGEKVRSEMEARLGADFSDVRMHTGAAAQSSSAQLGARAYTSGHHIVVGRGGCDRHTLAHELTHVIQQRRGPVAGKETGDGITVSDPVDAFEHVAEANASRVLSAPLPEPPPGRARCNGDERGNHAHGETSTPVQRAVGFEFEAQWNVRRVDDPAAAEGTRGDREKDWERLVDARILARLFEEPYEYSRARFRSELLTNDDSKTDDDQLRKRFLVEGLPTLAGEAVVAGSKYGRGKPDRKAIIHSLMVSSEVPEKPLFAGENIGKGDLVVAGAKFKLAADASPTGGSNLEWITHPLTTADDVREVLGNITKQADFLNSRESDQFIPSEDVTAGGGEPQRNLRIYPWHGQLAFAPQVTAGMRLDRLTSLIKYLENEEKSFVEKYFSVFVPGRVAGRANAKSDLSSGGNPAGLGALPQARAGAERAVKRLLETTPELKPSLGKPETKALAGLVMHLGAYLIAGAELQAKANAKTIAGALMARTDFAYAFSLLSTSFQSYFRDRPQKFVELVLDAAGLGGTGDKPLFGASVERGTANKRKETVIRLTRANWLTMLPGGHDLLKNWEFLTAEEQESVKNQAGAEAENQAGAEAVHMSMGALGKQENKVLVGEREIGVAVSEFRRMKDNLTAAALTPLAISVFELVEQLNQNRKLTYRRGT